MADALGQPLEVVESLQTHTPPDTHAQALVRAQEHGEELQQRQQSQPPPTPVRLVHHAMPHVHNPASSAWGHAHQVQHNILDGGDDPPQFAWPSQNIAAVAMLLRGLPEPADP